MVDEASHHPTSIVEGQWSLRPDSLTLEGLVEALLLAIGLGVVGLGVVRRGSDMFEADLANERLEVTSDELGAIVRDDLGPVAWIGLPPTLEDGFDIRFGKVFADLPVDDGPMKPSRMEQRS